MKRFTEVGYKRAVRLVGSFSSSQSLCTFVRSEQWVPSVFSTRAWEVPGCSQLSHICSLLSAKHTGRGHAQRRGLIGSTSWLFIPANPDHHHHHHQRVELEGDVPSCSGNQTRRKLVSLNSFPVYSNCYTVLALKSQPALRR